MDWRWATKRHQRGVTWVNALIGNVKNAITGTYHAINPKHLPLYLAEFYYRHNRRFLLEGSLSRFAYIGPTLFFPVSIAWKLRFLQIKVPCFQKISAHLWTSLLIPSITGCFWISRALTKWDNRAIPTQRYAAHETTPTTWIIRYRRTRRATDRHGWSLGGLKSTDRLGGVSRWLQSGAWKGQKE